MARCFIVIVDGFIIIILFVCSMVLSSYWVWDRIRISFSKALFTLFALRRRDNYDETH